MIFVIIYDIIEKIKPYMDGTEVLLRDKIFLLFPVLLISIITIK